MRYFRAVNMEDPTIELYLSCDHDDFEVEQIKQHLGLETYALTECSQNEYETMTQDVNDFIINVGVSRSDCGPFESAATESKAIKRAKELAEEYPCVEVVYMPQDDFDVNEIVWEQYR
jgi:hypothetical protein